MNKLPEGYDPFHTLYNHISLLSAREREVYDYLYSPLNNSEIAKELFIQPKTVKFHLTNIYRKLKVKNRNQLLGKILVNDAKSKETNASSL